MNNIICHIQNPTTSTLRRAKFASKCGMQKCSTKILENYFGKQVKTNPQEGLRAFLGRWSDGRQHIEVINGNFMRKAHGVILGEEGVEASIFKNGKSINKSYETAEQMLFDVMG